MAYTDGSVYDGAWKYNKRHGDGLYKYANGDRYAGRADDLRPDLQPDLQTTYSRTYRRLITDCRVTNSTGTSLVLRFTCLIRQVTIPTLAGTLVRGTPGASTVRASTSPPPAAFAPLGCGLMASY